MTTLLSSRSLISSNLPGLLHQIKDRNRRSKPRTLLSSRSLVPLVGSSSSDQGSKLVTNDVSLASHGDSFAISANTEDDSLLLTESRRSTCVVFSAISTIATEDGLCLAPHGDSSYFM
ncbi:hypothetical protein DY000_02035822 [Brassica cretica]|uniref:Uncharacterized protein n=1 Tax=Brassica cretica TaxID=69181 RepID=A0ABQ7DW67_BRACR|nr:hypothetical protein DY000_02035822 [Brassica cretica]